MHAVHSSEKLVNIQQTAKCHIQEDWPFWSSSPPWDPQIRHRLCNLRWPRSSVKGFSSAAICIAFILVSWSCRPVTGWLGTNVTAQATASRQGGRWWMCAFGTPQFDADIPDYTMWWPRKPQWFYATKISDLKITDWRSNAGDADSVDWALHDGVSSPTAAPATENAQLALFRRCTQMPRLAIT